MQFIEEHASIPVCASYDVIVAGGGVAGVAAALSSARLGKRTLLIEKSLTLDGLATLGLINLFVPMCNGHGRQIVTGMAEELLRLSIRYGYDTIPQQWQQGAPGEGATSRYVTRFSAGIFALTMAELLQDEGVALLLDSVVSKAVMQGRRCQGLIVENKSGRQFYPAGVVVDATGDADILYRAGVPTVQGKNFFTYSAWGISLESCRRAVDEGRIDRAVYARSGGRATLYGQNHPEGMELFEGTTAEEVTQYVLKNQRVLLDSIKAEPRFARDIVTLPGMAQLRTTRRIEGDYTLTVEDCYAHFSDSIGAICDFDQRDFLYEVPLRCLCRAEYANLLTAGRSASAAGYAWDVLRVIPPAILTGQAAGIAAAQALEQDRSVGDVDLRLLQKALAGTGVLIHFEDEWIPAAPSNVQSPDIGHI